MSKNASRADVFVIVFKSLASPLNFLAKNYFALWKLAHRLKRNFAIGNEKNNVFNAIYWCHTWSKELPNHRIYRKNGNFTVFLPKAGELIEKTGFSLFSRPDGNLSNAVVEKVQRTVLQFRTTFEFCLIIESLNHC